jgi:hypothetical protein
MTKQTVQLVAPMFDKYASAIIKTKTQAHTAMTKADTAIDVTMQQFIDAWAVAGFSKTKEDIDRLGKAIRDSETVKNLTETSWLKRKTFTEYANSAMRAYFYDVPFEQGLKNKPEFILPWGGAKSDKAKTNGKVTTTTRAELDKTISKALEQARALGLLNFAADLVDLATESLDGFSE